ncbi:sensor histidine kinase [Paenibacillus sp. TRM 82003]|nr:sensor histidine kinase [Paenibacillus sp. TRM 82003]
MKLKHFLMDRLLYIVMFFGSTLLTVSVVQLDLARQGASLHIGNVAYVGVLAGALLFCWLIVDYARQRSYYRELTRMLAASERLDEAVLLRSGTTAEQRQVQRAVERLHAVYADTLTQYRRSQTRNLHQLQQWAHQMKTPVAVIDLLTQRAKDAANADGAMDSIREEADRIHSYISMMLETARLESFERDVRIRRVDAAAMVRGVVNELRGAWIRAGVFPKLESDEGSPVFVETDEKWASFVCRQLLSNAVKYSAAAKRATTDGEGETRHVVIEVRRTEDGAVVRISDEGIGIPPEDLPRVFEPFFTGANGRLVPESTGMGLYLAKEACDRLGHRLTARSVPGEGAVFELAFPRTTASFREAVGR